MTKLALEAKPTGVALMAICDLRMKGCTATLPAPVTVVNVGPSSDQFIVCRSCLETMIREGEWEVRHARIVARPDFMLVDSVGHSIMAVEVKGMPHSSALDIDLWATSLRRNLVVHAAIPKTPFFLLLAMPDYGFLWSSPEKSAEAPPDYRIYLPSTGLNFASNSKGYDSQAEGMAAGFLQALVEGRLDTSEDWWKESGLRYYIEKRHLKVVREGPQNVRGLA